MKNIAKNLQKYAEIFRAYADCNGLEAERNLDFISKKSVTAEELKSIMPKAIPDGYNDFDPIKSIAEVVELFGDRAEYFVAREGSVCIYVKPTSGQVWLGTRRGLNFDLTGDEVSFCAKKQMFRIWWD